MDKNNFNTVNKIIGLCRDVLDHCNTLSQMPTSSLVLRRLTTMIRGDTSEILDCLSSIDFDKQHDRFVEFENLRGTNLITTTIKASSIESVSINKNDGMMNINTKSGNIFYLPPTCDYDYLIDSMKNLGAVDLGNKRKLRRLDG